MCLVRCKDHEPQGRKVRYVKSVKPLNYPNTAAICGLSSCDQPGLVWLTEEEKERYNDGDRIFWGPSSVMHVKVS